MGLFQDQTDSLSELRRLAALVQDPNRLHEIGKSQWPLAMISYGLATCNDESNFDYSLEIYPHFVSHSQPTERLRTLRQLSEFITRRKGDGWRAFVNFALADPLDEIRRHAAFLTATLVPSTGSEEFCGINEVLHLWLMPQREGLPSSTPLIDAVLSLSDKRFLPILTNHLAAVSQEKLSRTLEELNTSLNILSGEWLLACLETHPGTAEGVCSAFCRLARQTEQVLDLILPLPSWQFQNPSPQPLHGWTRSEYFPRILPRIQDKLSSEQIERMRQAFI